MLVDIIFLSVCSLIVAHSDVNKPLIEELRTGGSFLGESSRSHDFVFGEDQPSNKRLRSESWGNPIEDSQAHITGGDKKDVINSKVPAMKENWEKNQNDLRSLRQESMELKDMKWEMMEELKSVQCCSNSDCREQTLNLRHDIEALLKIYDRLETFKQIKLLELAKADFPKSNSNLLDLLILKEKEEANTNKNTNPTGAPLPVEVVETISQKAWVKVGNGIINDLMDLIMNQKLVMDISRKYSLFGQHSLNSIEKKSMLWLRFAFEMVDFMFENNFADKEAVRNFFQNPAIIEQVIKYTESRFNKDIGESIYFGRTFSLMTEHWYWPRLHKSFRALGKKEEDILNANLLLRFRHKRFLRAKYQGKAKNPAFESAASFLREFDTQWYLSELRKPSDKISKVDHEREKHITDDILRIIEIIERSGTESWGSMYLRRHLDDILDFIEQKISPGIMSTTSFNDAFIQVIGPQERLWKFNNRFNISKIMNRIGRLHSQAKGYYKFIKRKYPSSWSSSSHHKSNFDKYILQMVDLSAQIPSRSFRLLQNLGNTDDYQQVIYEIERIGQKSEGLIEELQKKSDSFSHTDLN